MAKPLINDLFIKNKDLYTIIYNRRYNIIRRCYNVNDPAYKYYGGSGIDVCDEWLNESTGFLNFYNWFIKYNPDNIFKNKKRNITNEESIAENVSMVKYKESIFTKIKKWVRIILNK